MNGNIQEGINWNVGDKPRSHYKLILIQPLPRISALKLRSHLAQIWLIFQSLKKGVLPSLGLNYPVDPQELQVLIGYGHKFFERDDLLKSPPEEMIYQNRFPQPNVSNKRCVLPGSGIIYDIDIQTNDADEEIAIQVTANSSLAVHRVEVELLKYIDKTRRESTTNIAPFSLKITFDGFGREDRRSWIDFHDGISNLRKGDQRRQVVAVKPDNSGKQDWTINGTFMVFMRLPVNIQIWESISTKEQEVLVGRTKQSGCPLTRLDNQGNPITDSKCPVSGTKEIIEHGNEQFREPSPVVTDDIKISHVQRANHHRSPVSRPDSRRIYRQGYEFLERNNGRSKIGLNFVSFQDDPDRTFFILTHSDWLGNLSFGGNPKKQKNNIDKLISVRAAGTFFVPPVLPNLAFPGEQMFLIE